MTKIQDLVLTDRRPKVRETTEAAGISKDCVGHIRHDILCMRNQPDRWVPLLLIPDNKRNRQTTSEQRLTLLKRNPKEFLRHFMTVDGTWVH